MCHINVKAVRDRLFLWQYPCFTRAPNMADKVARTINFLEVDRVLLYTTDDDDLLNVIADYLDVDDVDQGM